MERRGLTEQSAFETLRATARKRRRKLEEVGRELVEATERLNGI
jgi:AmiR/NasT family two-component response regulator